MNAGAGDPAKTRLRRVPGGQGFLRHGPLTHAGTLAHTRRDEFASRRRRIAAMRARREAMQARISSLQARFAEIFPRFSDRVACRDARQAHIPVVHPRRTAFSVRSAEMRAPVSSVRGRRATVPACCAEKTTRREAPHATISSLRARIAALRARIAEIPSRIAAIRPRRSAVRTRAGARMLRRAERRPPLAAERAGTDAMHVGEDSLPRGKSSRVPNLTSLEVAILDSNRRAVTHGARRTAGLPRVSCPGIHAGVPGFETVSPVRVLGICRGRLPQ
jgi:hypothetical protein